MNCVATIVLSTETQFSKMRFLKNNNLSFAVRRSFSKKYKSLSSALHITSDMKGEVFSSLDPHLDCAEVFDNLDEFKKNMSSRNLDIDGKDMKNSYLKYFKLKDVFNDQQLQVKEYVNSISDIKKKSFDENSQQRIDSLREKISIIKCLNTESKRNLIELEYSFVIPYLSLPNRLHPSTGEEKTLLEILSLPNFSYDAKSHMLIGSINDELSFKNVSPYSFFLKGRAAVLELACIDYLSLRLKSSNYTMVSNMEFTKAVIVEGCGVDPKSKKMLRIVDDDCRADNDRNYLVGGASVYSFVALFCKSVLTNPENELPIRLSTVGRHYSNPVENDANGLFNPGQSTSAQTFILYHNDDKTERILLDEIIELISEIYGDIGLHVKLTRYSASSLKMNECLAIGIRMFSPISKEYVEIGRVSLLSDYVSKRLYTLEKVNLPKTASFLGMIHVELMNITKFIGCVMENTQNLEGNYIIPPCLTPHMYGMECKLF